MAGRAKHLTFLLVAGLLSAATIFPAAADSCGEGDVGDIDMSCNGLWRERNRVYAQHGYCFKTPRAIRAFGTGCFPPYGRLGKSDQCYVRALAKLERQRGCPSG